MRRRRTLRQWVFFVSGVMLGSWAALTPTQSYSAKTKTANVGANDPRAQIPDQLAGDTTYVVLDEPPDGEGGFQLVLKKVA